MDTVPKNLLDLVELANEFGINLTINRLDVIVDERIGCTRYEFKIQASGTSYAKNKEEVDLLKMTQEMLKNGS